MRILYSFLLYFSLVKLSFSWECDERCPEYLKCVAEEEAKQSNNTRRLFLPQTNLFDAPYFDVYEQQGPKTLDMSVFTTSNMNGLRGGPMQRRRHGRILQEVYFQLKLYHELVIAGSRNGKIKCGVRNAPTIVKNGKNSGFKSAIRLNPSSTLPMKPCQMVLVDASNH
jgi:hypothetical protein